MDLRAASAAAVSGFSSHPSLTRKGTIAETGLASLVLPQLARCWLILSASCCALRVRVTPLDSNESFLAGSTSQRGCQTALHTLQAVLERLLSLFVYS